MTAADQQHDDERVVDPVVVAATSFLADDDLDRPGGPSALDRLADELVEHGAATDLTDLVMDLVSPPAAPPTALEARAKLERLTVAMLRGALLLEPGQHRTAVHVRAEHMVDLSHAVREAHDAAGVATWWTTWAQATDEARAAAEARVLAGWSGEPVADGAPSAAPSPAEAAVRERHRVVSLAADGGVWCACGRRFISIPAHDAHVREYVQAS